MNQPPTRRKAISYLRFSTGRQEKGSSDFRQTTSAQEFAARNNLELIDTFEDRGVSAFRGKNIREGEFATLLDAYRNGEISPDTILLVDDVSRLSRAGLRPVQRTLDELMDLGVTTVFIDKNLWITSESYEREYQNAIMIVMEAIGAQKFSLDQARRIKAWHKSRVHKLSEGDDLQNIGNLCPKYIDPATRKLNDRSKVVRRIITHCLKGGSMLSITRDLNAEGVPTFSGKGIWRSSQIQNLLNNPAIYGAIEFPKNSGNIHDDQFEAIATKEEYELLQVGFKDRRGNQKRKTGVNVFSGLAKCSLCGSGMTRVTASKGLAYLRCTGKRDGNGCIAKGCRYDAVVDVMWKLYPTIRKMRGERRPQNVDALKEKLASLKLQKQRAIADALSIDDVDIRNELYAQSKQLQAEIDATSRSIKSIEAEASASTGIASEKMADFYQAALAELSIDTSKGAQDFTLYIRGNGETDYLEQRVTGYRRTVGKSEYFGNAKPEDFSGDR